MTAFLKFYTDSAHTSEVTHTASNSTTLNGSVSIGATSIVVTSTTTMPSQGYLDIDTGGNLESVPYVSISGTTINLAQALSKAHSSGVVVVQWVYQLNVGDQTNGILNDGTNATPGVNNTGTWYLYNAGDQTAQSISMFTSSASPSTTNGYSDTLISITGPTTGFATSASISSLTAGAQQQVWIVAEIPTNQQTASSLNPQTCLITLSLNSI